MSVRHIPCDGMTRDEIEHLADQFQELFDWACVKSYYYQSGAKEICVFALEDDFNLFNRARFDELVKQAH